MNIPAFPAMHFDLADNEHGMTLRDYFAAKAMQALIQHHYFDVAAKKSYEVADAMLKARQA